MYLSATAHWVKYFYFQELIVTEIHTLRKWLLNPAPKARMEIGFSKFPLASWKGCWSGFIRSAGFPNTGTCCCFHGHMHGNLKDLEKQSPSSMSCINTSPSGIYSLPCSCHFQASHSLFFPKRSCVTPTLSGPCWSLKTSKALPPQVGKNPRAHIKAQIPAFLLPLPAQQCKEAAGSCVCTPTILRKWRCLAELDPLHHYWTSTVSWLIKSSNYPWINAYSQGWTWNREDKNSLDYSRYHQNGRFSG